MSWSFSRLPGTPVPQPLAPMSLPLPAVCTTRHVLNEVGCLACVLDEEGRVVAANDAARSLARVGELVGRSFLGDLNGFPCPVPGVPRGITAGVSAVLNGRKDHFPHEHVCPLGGEKICSFRAFRMVNGDASRVVVFHEDITERRTHERRAYEAQRLEALGLLAGGVAHDFNNLLSVILGAAELMVGRGAGDDIDGEISEIKGAAERGAALTRQLLAFGRRQPGQVRAVDPNSVIVGLEPMLSRLLGEAIEIVLDLEEGPLPVMADPSQLERVIMNLVVNSRDAMPGGGRITISTRGVATDEEVPLNGDLAVAPAGWVRLTVADSGEGMPREVRERLFEPFFTTKAPGQGTGLGLPMAHGIIKQYGGYLAVDTAPGEGTIFRIYLPRSGFPVVEDADPPLAGEQTSGLETILLVEDDDSVRRVAHRLLERLGYTVIEAATAAEALVKAESHDGPLHLCLTDVVMPGMSGSDLAEELRTRRPDLPVLFMSGYTRDELDTQAIIEGHSPFLSKPFSAEYLASAVRGALDQA